MEKSGSRRSGRVAVAKYNYRTKKMPPPPTNVPGPWKSVLIHSSDKGYAGKLSPFHFCDEKGRKLENVWQFAKVYEEVEPQNQKMSQWEWPRELHFAHDRVIPEYWVWRNKGMTHTRAVRYPNGFKGRTKCKFALWPKDGLSEEQAGTDEANYDRLDYIESRKRIYCGEYIRLAPEHPTFLKLKDLRESGTNILIVEVDGPTHSLTHAPYDRISKDQPCMLMDEEAIRLLVNDPIKPFGHGFVIAALLLGGAEWMK